MRCVLFITNGKTGNRSGMFFGMVPVRRAEPGVQSTRRNPKVAFPYYYHHPRGFPGEIIEPKGHTLQRGKEENTVSQDEQVKTGETEGAKQQVSALRNKHRKVGRAGGTAPNPSPVQSLSTGNLLTFAN